MEVVLAHSNTDFDSLAAQFAVTKLHAGVRMVVPPPLVSNIRSFLALYRDCLPIVDLAYVDLDKVKHVYVVDCQHLGRLSDIGRKLIVDLHCPYTVFDHHDIDPAALSRGASPQSIIKSVGACTSLIVEKLINENVELTAFEATLLAIGIYEDSGCLSYAGTTELDARCVAYLLAAGADLNQVNTFINPKLSPKQSQLLERLLANCRTLSFSGAKVIIAQDSCPEYIEGLATLTRRILEVSSADAAVTVVGMKDRVHVVGRSDHRAINMRDLMVELGGDGHAGAASAVVKNGSVAALVNQVAVLIGDNVRPEVTAKEIMSSPVRTIKHDMTMDEAGRIMLRYAQDGLVVTQNDLPTGVIAKRDIDKALHHKLGHAPVRGFMSRPVISIEENTTLSQIQTMMVKEDIGRLPVLDADGKLLGIVTRKNVLQAVYGKDRADSIGPMVVAEEHRVHFQERLAALDEQTQRLFVEIGKAAAATGMVAHAVGGCVRDMFLGRENFDLDFVIEGNAIDLAQHLEKMYADKFKLIAKHERFQTATLMYGGLEKREIDLSTARTEFYEFPAALPTVEPSLLEQDLFRRDFTINALAICINPNEYGDVIDFFRGIEDIESKLIRILHPFSFIEDPTRILRAVRFATRLMFELEEKTARQARRAIAMGIFDELGGFRLKEELRLLLESPQRLAALTLLHELGGSFAYISDKLHFDPGLRRQIKRAQRLLSHNPLKRDWLVYLGVLLSPLSGVDLETVLERLNLANEERDWLRSGNALPRDLDRQADQRFASNSAIYACLNGQADQALAIAACTAAPGSPVRRAIKLYLEQLRHIKPAISGTDLLQLGFPQGPEIKTALNLMLNARLDGEAQTREDELRLLQAKFPHLVRT